MNTCERHCWEGLTNGGQVCVFCDSWRTQFGLVQPGWYDGGDYIIRHKSNNVRVALGKATDRHTNTVACFFCNKKPVTDELFAIPAYKIEDYDFAMSCADCMPTPEHPAVRH